MPDKKTQPQLKDLSTEKNPKGGSTTTPGGPVPPTPTGTKIGKILDGE